MAEDIKNYVLVVPMDASNVKDFEPTKAVRVVAYAANGGTHQETVRLDKTGMGKASFSFIENPGAVKVALGPETATAEDLKNLQTITVSVPASAWRRSSTVELPVVMISSYDWWFWWRWCTNYTITGRVLCSDGVSPVAGATVSAIDVDWWWWWTSQEQVGTAVTAADGSFEITFERCCGWWPWFWWETREWALDPFVVEKITQAFEGSDLVGLLPRAVAKPSLGVFQNILASSSSGRSSAKSRNAISLMANTEITAADLEPLREKLANILPAEFPYRIWPWEPWWPWLDCGANIIFNVTQNCSGTTNTIVSETIADTRWDIATGLVVSLTSNTQACCVHDCDNDAKCAGPGCLIPGDICGFAVGSIGGNTGNSATGDHIGLVNPGVSDNPFAGVVWFDGSIGDGIDYYEFLISTTGTPGSFVPINPAANVAFNRTVLLVTPGSPPTFSWPAVPFGLNAISDGTTMHNVIETMYHYDAVNGTPQWSDTNYFTLQGVETAQYYSHGTFYLQLVGYEFDESTGLLTDMKILPLCDPNRRDRPVDNLWAVQIDNRAPGNTDPSGQLCGVHVCTDQPASDLVQVMIVHASDGSTEVLSGCDLACISPDDTLVIDFVAYDPDGFLDTYGMELYYGSDQSVDLLDRGLFTTWSLTTSPIAPAGHRRLPLDRSVRRTLKHSLKARHRRIGRAVRCG